MTVNNRLYNESIIHHSDRGSQYCSHKNVDLLISNNIAISMTEKGDSYKCHGRKVNGIIKMEFNLYESTLGFDQTKIKINNSIKTYNELRPHASCDYLTQNAAYLKSEKLKKRRRNYNRSFNYLNALV